jgi:hypothetical protein
VTVFLTPLHSLVFPRNISIVMDSYLAVILAGWGSTLPAWKSSYFRALAMDDSGQSWAFTARAVAWA